MLVFEALQTVSIQFKSTHKTGARVCASRPDCTLQKEVSPLEMLVLCLFIIALSVLSLSR